MRHPEWPGPTPGGPSPGAGSFTPAAILALGLLGGCSYMGSARDFDPADLAADPSWIAVVDVPFVRQQASKDCGAAALAMVLAYWRTEGSLEEIVKACQPAPDLGIKAGALRDFAVNKGLQAFLVEGRPADLEHELLKRRPVIVGLLKPQWRSLIAHYEVVVAIHPTRKIVVTLDPAHGWRQNGYEGFDAEWEPSQRVTIVVTGKLDRAGGD